MPGEDDDLCEDKEEEDLEIVDDDVNRLTWNIILHLFKQKEK